jgi:hypothetical protein
VGKQCPPPPSDDSSTRRRGLAARLTLSGAPPHPERRPRFTLTSVRGCTLSGAPPHPECLISKDSKIRVVYKPFSLEDMAVLEDSLAAFVASELECQDDGTMDSQCPVSSLRARLLRGIRRTT